MECKLSEESNLFDLFRGAAFIVKSWILNVECL